MTRSTPPQLSRRERQIMDIVYAAGEASAAQVREALPDPPSYSAVRALLAILVEKGHLKHRSERGRYIYAAVRRRTLAGKSALRGVLETFFDGSLEKAVAALLEGGDRRLSQTDLNNLAQLIDEARQEGR